MKRKIIITGLGMTVFVGWIVIGPWGCEWTPERDNPLDPNSNSFNPVLTGEVTNLANAPVSQAIVTLHPEGDAAVTGDDGVYRFEGVDLGEYTLTVQKTDHVGDTVGVNIISGGTVVQDFQINALPVFDSVSVTSHYIEQLPVYNIHINITAKITDSDGIPSGDSVLALFEEDTLDYLDYIYTIGIFSIFSKDFSSSMFEVANIESITGRPFFLIATDSNDGVSVSEPCYILRFLEPPTGSFSPDGGATVHTPLPTLSWTSYGSMFDYFQNVQVFDDNNSLIWDSLGIASVITQVTVTDTLPPTEPAGTLFYYWTLEIVDLFGNTSRSEELQFRIEWE